VFELGRPSSRCGERQRLVLVVGRKPRCACPISPLFLAKRLTGRCADEVDPGAGRTLDRHVSLRIGRRIGEPMLHIHPRSGAPEKNETGHGRLYAGAGTLSKTTDDY